MKTGARPSKAARTAKTIPYSHVMTIFEVAIVRKIAKNQGSDYELRNNPK
jgi:hypothetical protein